MDPCEPGWEPYGDISAMMHYVGEEPFDMHYFLDVGTTFVAHIVVRGTYVPGTVRCLSGDRFLLPSYWRNAARYSRGRPLIKCYADLRVNAYVLGSGPATLTVEVAHDLYPPTWGEADVLERKGLWETALNLGGVDIENLEDINAVVGTEAMLFIGPSLDTSVVGWKLFNTWNIERREDGTVIAVHPHRDAFDIEDHRSAVELEFPAFKQAVTRAHQARVAEHGGRIAPEDSDDEVLPMLVTDANQLRQFFIAVGPYGETDIPPTPPPACGLAVTDQADNPGLMQDCIALLAAKDKLRGTATLNWSVNTAITGWDGVTTGGTPSRVTKLLLPSKSLSGSIPGELGDLSGLTHLDLSSNSLTGEIPWELGKISNLTEVRLSGNSLTGCIPPALKDASTNDLSSLSLLYCPQTPGGLTAGTTGENSVPLSWTAVANAGKYRVEYRDPYNSRWTVDDETVTGATHTVDGLQCFRRHQFRVRAYGDGTNLTAAWGAPSAWVEARTLRCASPVFEDDPYEFSVAEDAAIETEVGVVSADDPQDDTVAYSITEGNDDGKFAIDGSTGAITVAAALDHETTASYTLKVQASDGTNAATATVEIAVTDVNESPVFESETYSFSVAENASVWSTVGRMTAPDPDAGDTSAGTVFYYITAGNGAGKFSISTGRFGAEIIVQAALGYETKSSYTLTVEARDGKEGGTSSVTVEISVTNVNEAPSFDAEEYSFTVPENSATGHSVGTAAATDPDDGDALTYSISGDAFAIDASGAIMVGAALDHEGTES